MIKQISRRLGLRISSAEVHRIETLLAATSGKLTVSEGARRLSLSRHRFRELMRRGEKGMIEALSSETRRPVTPSREKQQDKEFERLSKENRILQARLDTVQRLLKAAGKLVEGRQKKSVAAPAARRAKSVIASPE